MSSIDHMLVTGGNVAKQHIAYTTILLEQRSLFCTQKMFQYLLYHKQSEVYSGAQFPNGQIFMGQRFPFLTLLSRGFLFGGTVLFFCVLSSFSFFTAAEQPIKAMVQ